MGLKNLFWVLLGFFVGFLIVSFWKGDFDWNLLIFLMIGGVIGHFTIAFIRRSIEQNKHGNE